MAGNDWINSYLEAILDVGPGLDDAKSSLLLRERGRFSPTRYFVDNVIGFDETDLHRSWVKASFFFFVFQLIDTYTLLVFVSVYVDAKNQSNHGVAQATRSPQERNTRLENMCWRIWNLARQKNSLRAR
ncbi:unnamed protein product [Lactuca virosa]|uniref:Sucrose synthase n=1 Tax=Lactuca virosa TaxID=75947 RepID=A0AAU9MQP0_9ASTR|nr:unnamed protein product [Lactuca virosa]